MKVSVCLLSYNHAHSLPRAIDSILRQSLPKFELIISDDCSKDNSWDVIQTAVAKNPVIKAIRTAANLGMPGNTNFAIGYATGDVIALLHHDDTFHPDLLKTGLSLFQRNKKLGFVFYDVANKEHNTTLHTHHSMNRNFPEVIDGLWFLRNDLLRYWGCSVWGSALIKKDCFDEIGGIDPVFEFLADIDLWMRLAYRYDVGYIREPMIFVTRDRPLDYPEEYGSFSWKRWRLAFDIHATNIRRVNRDKAGSYILRWFRFRTRVSIEILRWLAYGIIKNRRDIILRCRESDNPYEFLPLRLLKRILVGFVTRSKGDVV
ncbi:MAG: glycosyltransferase family 2 protein [Methylococcales bacterium]